MENNLAELWSIFEFVLLGYLPSQVTFRQKFERAASAGEEKATLADLRRYVRSYILCRLKREVLSELPPKIETTLYTEMTVKQRSVYRSYFLRAREECVAEVAANGFAQSRMKILAWLTRLRLICCHPSLFLEGYQGDSGKEELFLFVASEAAAARHRLLVFSQFASMLLLREALAKKGFVVFISSDLWQRRIGCGWSRHSIAAPGRSF